MSLDFGALIIDITWLVQSVAAMISSIRPLVQEKGVFG